MKPEKCKRRTSPRYGRVEQWWQWCQWFGAILILCKGMMTAPCPVEDCSQSCMSQAIKFPSWIFVFLLFSRSPFRVSSLSPPERYSVQLKAKNDEIGAHVPVVTHFVYLISLPRLKKSYCNSITYHPSVLLKCNWYVTHFCAI